MPSDWPACARCSRFAAGTCGVCGDYLCIDCSQRYEGKFVCQDDAAQARIDLKRRTADEQAKAQAEHATRRRAADEWGQAVASRLSQVPYSFVDAALGPGWVVGDAKVEQWSENPEGTWMTYHCTERQTPVLTATGRAAIRYESQENVGWFRNRFRWSPARISTYPETNDWPGIRVKFDPDEAKAYVLRVYEVTIPAYKRPDSAAG